MLLWILTPGFKYLHSEAAFSPDILQSMSHNTKCQPPKGKEVEKSHGVKQENQDK